ncbi:glycosyltransferase family 4 protein [Algoriphagus halophilus]|uniref:Glycosyltransferase involved in cell wall bisynthesis n=1 Tax=Algoriphagus halophilus TaxID=226505 RepID=A0A1N6HFG9_9BACT|nr:glycosyltransferase family 4 protein [Algoriphagus halophilus]SIO18588.1 Glycosyltransferase involved in cell wall bisynthesis [Algoriphagus halophilus]
MIIYTYPVRTAFTDRDLEMIRPEMKIKALEFTQNPIHLPLFYILQFFQLLWYLPKTSQYLCFFGGYHSVLPVWFAKIFGKKCIIQAGGMDCINMPEIGYGNFRKKWLRKATIFSFKNCTLILPVAQALVKQHYQFDTSISPHQGLINLIPDLTTPIQVIPNGFDTNFWKNLQLKRVPFSFITVASGTSNPSRAMVKGYDLIEKLAANHPDWKFTFVGDSSYQSKNPNVSLLGKKTASELLTLYNTHQFYLQLSTSEGFPNSLGEAMSCGCIPIGSAVGAIPEIIEKKEFILVQKDIKELELLVSNILSSDYLSMQDLFSQRIHTLYSYSRRKTELLLALSQ